VIFAGRIETTCFKNKFVIRVFLLIGGFDMPFATAQGYSTTDLNKINRQHLLAVV